MRATQHFHYGLLLSIPKEKKQNYLHEKAPNKQNIGYLLVITTTGIESNVGKSYN